MSRSHHLAVGIALLATSALGASGLIAGGDQALLRPEHFDAKQVVVMPAGDEYPNGVRIVETVDIDFGVSKRRGFQRVLPNDFGEAVDITASSPDANEELDIYEGGSNTRIRIGNPDVTFTGQHRYVLGYTLPMAQIGSGDLLLDIIGNSEPFVTDRFEVVLVGFDLSETTCDVGWRNTFGGCELQRDAPARYSVVFEPLERGQGITVGGRIDATAQAAQPVTPDLPDRNPRGIRPLGLIQVMVGLAAATLVYFGARRLGRNEVFGLAGAADAAFGSGIEAAVTSSSSTRRISDSGLADLATTEFSPPPGLTPWQGNVLLNERVGDETVSAWYAEMVGCGAIKMKSAQASTMRRGDTSAIEALGDVDRSRIDALFSTSSSVKLNSYSKNFATLWSRIATEQQQFVARSGWWARPIPGTRIASGLNVGVVAISAMGAVVVLWSAKGTIASAALTSLTDPFRAVMATAIVVALVALGAYRSLLPSRTASGSALALRTESFRRFLAASEGQHVEWAWERDCVREYSAWAVALGEAEAWSAAIEASTVDATSSSALGPIYMNTNARSFRSARTKPSSGSGSSGSSGSRGFSGGGGGGVGRGGGGGSSGSW